MKIIINACLSLVIWLVTALMTLFVYIAVLLIPLVPPFDRTRKQSHSVGFLWAEIITGVNPFWETEVSGLENIDRKKVYVVVANHQSMADIVMLYKTHLQFKWVAKESLFSVPVIGWCMSRMKYIKLLRGNLSSIKEAYDEAGDWLKEGVSVLFFPEGTRSRTGEMNPFKNGAFKLAIKEKIPVLPVYIYGTAKAIPKDSWIFKTKVFCKVKVLSPIETTRFSDDEFELLSDTVRKQLIAASLT